MLQRYGFGTDVQVARAVGRFYCLRLYDCTSPSVFNVRRLQRYQRIHSSGLKIPVGRTCGMLLWVCERSLKASAVFTKGCDLL